MCRQGKAFLIVLVSFLAQSIALAQSDPACQPAAASRPVYLDICAAPIVVCPPSTPAPALAAAAMPYAQPTPAPPSEQTIGTETAGNKPGRPIVIESLNYYDSYALAHGKGSSASPTSGTLALWNLTNHEVTVRVDGQSHTLEPGKNLTLTVGRRFIWQVEGREPQTERIATGEVGIEIVLRR
jgi:hypothetical protein